MHPHEKTHKLNQYIIKMSYTTFTKRFKPVFQVFLFLFVELSDTLLYFEKITPRLHPEGAIFCTPSETVRNVPTNLPSLVLVLQSVLFLQASQRGTVKPR